MREDWAPEHQVEIEKKAYYLWEAAGRPNDQSLDFWVQAEEIYKEEYLEKVGDIFSKKAILESEIRKNIGKKSLSLLGKYNNWLTRN